MTRCPTVPTNFQERHEIHTLTRCLRHPLGSSPSISAISREVADIVEHGDIQYSIERYVEWTIAVAAGHQIAELDPAQAILIGALANSGFDIEAAMASLPSQERRLVAAAGQLAERFVALGLVHPDSLQNDGDSTFLLLRAYRLLSSRAVATVLDAEEEGQLASYLTSSTVELNDLPHSVAARALSFAPLYVLRSVPFLADLKAEAILAWKEELADSLGEYRQECASAALGAEDITLAETSQYLREVGQHLDGLYVGCLRSMRASPTWKVGRDRASGFISPLAAGGLSLQLTGDSAIAAATLGAGSLANALVIIAEGMRM